MTSAQKDDQGQNTQYQKALEYLEISKTKAIQAENRQYETSCNEQIGICYFYLAEVYLKLSDTVQARRYFDERISIAKELRNERMLGLFEKLGPQISLYERQRSLQMRLNERQQKGLEHVKQHAKIANRTYQKVTGATPKQARNDLKDLVEKGVFKKVGRGCSLRYELVEQGR